ncbi:hypothetical protein PC129_g11125 [Phytophthora cactorum]|uniref:PWWP domain-containing protein n=2 Tax=Phytophthora cactorum TaxID=29920 RepID=A0A329S056_9STRA|nr:hypothetical protein Pcac1_g1749 [Phytophthora cactorum]KAG2820621.1 hypothetical protein PC112_g11705 [Phytophthora cactorum]KAG2822750.1 hypothetical protein PC111_g10509 [Phytophthora cactorum]KAG2855687.1 hypothetical protein PC113_g12231 [Phytophthora cactorum]KAG2902188.1 hypothetical protein PC114_g12845 [Phytophthora cactorum]
MPRPVSSPPPLADLHEGDWLDVMDHDGIWSVARVLSVQSPEELEITYDGWPSDYDEVVEVDSSRVAPYQTFTWSVKCWIRHLNWPMWPGVVTIRSPGTEVGLRNLNKENRLQVDFMDSSSFARRARCWLLKGHVKPFGEKHDERRQGSNGNQFEQAYGFVLQSGADDALPKFVPRGSLPMKYKGAPAESVETKRKEMGNAEWFARFAKNQELHQLTHQYSTLDGDGDDAASINSVNVALQLETTAAMPEQKTAKPKAAKSKKEKQTTAPKKQETKASARKAMPAVEEEKMTLNPKRTKLPTAVEQEENTASSGEEEEIEEKPKRPKLSTRVGHEKSERKGKKTKLTTAVKRAKALPISSNRRLLCVKK